MTTLNPVAPILKVIYSPRSLTIKKSTSARLLCAFSSNRKTGIWWQREGRPLPKHAKIRTVTTHITSSKGIKIPMVMLRLYLGRINHKMLNLCRYTVNFSLNTPKHQMEEHIDVALWPDLQILQLQNLDIYTLFVSE